MRTDNRGFTLVEVILVLVVSAIIVFPIGNVLNSVSYNFWSKHRNYRRVSDLNVVMERIVSYLVSVRTQKDLVLTKPQAIKMRNQSGVIIGFKLKGSDLVMSIGSFQEKVFSDVKAFNLTYYDGDGEEVVLLNQTKMVKVEIVASGDSRYGAGDLIKRRLVNLWFLK